MGLLAGKKKLLGAAAIASILLLLIAASVLNMVVSSSGSSGFRWGSIDIEGLPDMITEEMVIGAIESEQKYKVPASLTLAQIILESSGDYPGGLSQLAYECHNLFGMKGIGPAGSKKYATREENASGSYVVYAQFRKYHNVKQSIEDHGRILTNSHYRPYTSGCKTPEEWAVAIQRAGYATAHNYSQVLIELMDTYGLWQFNGGGFIQGDGKVKGKFLWPTVKSAVITSYYGDRSNDPDLPPGATTWHDGIDIAASLNAPIYAADGGTVISAGPSGGYGNLIVIEHKKGIRTWYCHLNNGGVLVHAGQKVSRGQKIGLMGSTGVSGETHLDFRIYVNGTAKDPLKYVRK